MENGHLAKVDLKKKLNQNLSIIRNLKNTKDVY